MKKILIPLILLALFLCGCVSGEVTTTEPRTFPEIKGQLWWFDFEQDYAESDRLDDPRLQAAAQGIRVDYPLDTDEKVTAYAWELYGICVELGYFDETCEPCYISCYRGGVIGISYLDSQYIGSYYDGYAPILYVSTLDGHVIELTSNDA